MKLTKTRRKLLEMAEEGLPKPQHNEVTWSLYISFKRSLDKNHKYFDKDFYNLLKETAPYWFSKRERRHHKQPKDMSTYNRIITMARNANN